MIVNTTNLRNLYVSFSMAYQGGFAGVQPTWDQVAMTVPSTTLTQEYGWLGQMPTIREWIGERQIQNLNAYAYAIRNRDWELTIGVDRNQIEDDNLGLFAPLFTNMGRRTAEFPERLLWPMLPAGFVTPCYDGQYFFDTDHPVLDAGGNTYSVSNLQAPPGGTAAGPAWYLVDSKAGFKPLIYQTRKPFDFTHMDAPTDEVVFRLKQFRYGVDGRCNAGYGMWQVIQGSTAPLTPDTYGALREAMMGMKGDYGSPLGLKPDLLIVPPALEAPALRIVKEGLTPVFAGNTVVGAENIYSGTARVLVQPWLA